MSAMSKTKPTFTFSIYCFNCSLNKSNWQSELDRKVTPGKDIYGLNRPWSTPDLTALARSPPTGFFKQVSRVLCSGLPPKMTYVRSSVPWQSLEDMTKSYRSSSHHVQISGRSTKIFGAVVLPLRPFRGSHTHTLPNNYVKYSCVFWPSICWCSLCLAIVGIMKSSSRNKRMK